MNGSAQLAKKFHQVVFFFELTEPTERKHRLQNPVIVDIGCRVTDNETWLKN